MKLGKLTPKYHPRTLQLNRYLQGSVPLAPANKVYREYKTPDEAKQMFGNDTIGDCTCAGAANLLILASCHTGTVVIPTLEEVIELYSSVSGYDPSTGANDNGAAMTDVLEKLRTAGLRGHKILAWAAVDFTSPLHRNLAVDLFGATYVGVNFPSSAMEQFDAGRPWEFDPTSNIEGGHAIIHPGYGSQGGDYVTWGKWDQKAGSLWERTYIEEEYVVITEDWLDTVTQLTPGGLNLNELYAAVKSLSA